MSKTIPWTRRKALQEAHPDQLIRVWSLQAPAALEAARCRGWFTGDHPHSEMEDGPDTGFGRAYRWMRDRMAERIEGFSGDLPVWAWVKRPCCKPVPHSYGPTVLITALVPRRRMLLSDFGLFHSVLNGWAVTRSEEEFDRLPGPVPQGEYDPSWIQIFDLAPRPTEFARWAGQADVVQACIDRISLSEIVAVRPIACRPPNRRRLPTQRSDQPAGLSRQENRVG